MHDDLEPEDNGYLFEVLEGCKDVISEVVLTGKLDHENAAKALAAINVVTAMLMEDMELPDDGDLPFGLKVVTAQMALQPAPKPTFKFADIHSDVLSAVYSACDSAEDGNLQGWEIDLIESRIVECHGGKSLLKDDRAQEGAGEDNAG